MERNCHCKEKGRYPLSKSKRHWLKMQPTGRAGLAREYGTSRDTLYRLVLERSDGSSPKGKRIRYKPIVR